MAGSTKIWIDNAAPSCAAADLNGFKNENNLLITNSGQSLNTSDNTQTSKAVSNYVAGADYYASTNTLNAYSLTPIGGKQSPHVYFDGLKVRFRPSANNTGATTVNLNSLGAKNVTKSDGTTALSGGEFSITRDVFLRYDNANGVFILDAVNSIEDLSDTNISSPSDGDILQYNTSTSKWINVPSAVLPLNYISGLVIENDSGDTDHDIKVNTGIARSKDNTSDIEVSSAIIKQIDSNWSLGSSSGGFPSGLTLSADTWYHFYTIYNPSTLVTDAGFDTSLTAANLLADASGFTKYRRVGSILTDGSANIIQFVAFHNEGSGINLYYNTGFVDFSSTSGSFTETDLTITVPLGIRTRAILSAYAKNPNGGTIIDGIYTVKSKEASGNILIARSYDDGGTYPTPESNIGEIYTNVSQTVRHVAYNFASSGATELTTLGFIDFRKD